MSTFVSVGNATQPFQRLLDGVAAIVSRLPQPVVVQYGCGRFDVPGCQAHRLIQMGEFERLVATSELLILHAGAGSVIHALRVGKVPVIMPRRAALHEHLDDHQIEFAEALSQVGRVVVVHDAAQLGAAIDRALNLQRQLRGEMRVPELVRLVGDRLKRYAEARR